MIMRAIERGIPEERIARGMKITLAQVIRKRNLLNGICPELIKLLSDKKVALAAFAVFKKMKTGRQIEVANLMCDSNIYTQAFTTALLATTHTHDLKRPHWDYKIKGFSAKERVSMTLEMESVQEEYHRNRNSYSGNMISLILIKGYLNALLNNARIVRYLAQFRIDILNEFQNIAAMTALKCM